MDEKQFEILTSQLKEIIASLQKLQKDTQQVSSSSAAIQQQVSSNTAAIQQQVSDNQKAVAHAEYDRAKVEYDRERAERAERRAKRAKSHPGW